MSIWTVVLGIRLGLGQFSCHCDLLAVSIYVHHLPVYDHLTPTFYVHVIFTLLLYILSKSENTPLGGSDLDEPFPLVTCQGYSHGV